MNEHEQDKTKLTKKKMDRREFLFKSSTVVLSTLGILGLTLDSLQGKAYADGGVFDANPFAGKCPYCGVYSDYTGARRNNPPNVEYQMKCRNGHYYWVRNMHGPSY